jgi:hypothetical protein
MRKVIVPIIILLLVASCSTGISEEEYNNALATIADLEANEKSLTEQVSQFTTSTHELEALIEEKGDLFEELQEDYDELLSENADQKRQLVTMSSDIDKVMCEEELNGMTYDDILTISSKLMAWVTNQSWAERSNMTIRDTIWTNTDTKLHGVSYTASKDGQRYLTWFLVYFDEFGWSEGVFWLTEQCWLEFD